jgi:hypothetical protein
MLRLVHLDFIYHGISVFYLLHGSMLPLHFSCALGGTRH